MSKTDKFKAPVANEMASFEKKFRKAMSSKVPLLDKITHYIIKRKGKQMRPMFVFLTAKLLGEVGEQTYRAASLIELLHTATLVHDDVVDDANMRRGFFSINALWKNKIAVLVGDYLLSRCLLLATENNDFDLLKIVAKSVKEISEGELLQIEKARRLDIKEDVYFEIIRQKTASLIASCCEAGASSVTNDLDQIERMRLFGEKVGIAFQIKDDLFDYQNTNIIGKPTGIDIKEQKMTLPLIYVLSKAEKREKRWMIKIVKRHHNNPKKVDELVDFVKANGGLEYASSKMIAVQQEALELLESFPDNEARVSLRELVNYVIERKK
ncbi:MAG: octaprenyl-diphosphate synthase [Candidatus Azotimanducaceae bacterium]|jgi:octaprenyl-diphosphate synthase